MDEFKQLCWKTLRNKFYWSFWNFDVKFGAAWRNSGFAQIDIETNSSKTQSGTGIVLLKYLHKTGVDGSNGVNIGYFSINVNSGKGYDEASAQTSWNFK